MGMFDEIHCQYPLPENPPEWVKNDRFQTKDLENVMDEYTITAEGRLIHHCKKYEWVEDDDSFFGGHLHPIEEWDVDTQHHGDLVFYTSNITSSDGQGHFGVRPGTGERPFSFDYKARFTNGQLQWIQLVACEDAIEAWQKYHKEQEAEAEQKAAEAEAEEKAKLRYTAADLRTFATALLRCAGLAEERAAIVAHYLIEADLMGHSTHGLHLLAPYLQELESGKMVKEGEPTIIADHGSAITWDGNYLPGPWLIQQAMDVAFKRIQNHPVVTIVIRRSHHIACLAAYPKYATDQGLLLLLTCSDPRSATVAPYGGIKPVYSPDPIAAGIPTSGEPIILDISLSCTANGVAARSQQEGKRLPFGWLQDANGYPTNNPAVLSDDPPGSILPLGGKDLGYKGFALGLLVEALTASLGGHGRADHPSRWGASVFMQIINPAAFGGLDAFIREADWLADACRNNPVKHGEPAVRLPGSRALSLRAEQLQSGVVLYPTIIPALQPWTEKFNVPVPAVASQEA